MPKAKDNAIQLPADSLNAQITAAALGDSSLEAEAASGVEPALPAATDKDASREDTATPNEPRITMDTPKEEVVKPESTPPFDPLEGLSLEPTPEPSEESVADDPEDNWKTRATYHQSHASREQKRADLAEMEVLQLRRQLGVQNEPTVQPAPSRTTTAPVKPDDFDPERAFDPGTPEFDYVVGNLLGAMNRNLDSREQRQKETKTQERALAMENDFLQRHPKLTRQDTRQLAAKWSPEGAITLDTLLDLELLQAHRKKTRIQAHKEGVESVRQAVERPVRRTIAQQAGRNRAPTKPTASQGMNAALQGEIKRTQTRKYGK